MTLSQDVLARHAAKVAEHLEQVAARIVLPSLGRDDGHHWSSTTQVHTEADDRAGAALAELFRESFPDHGLVIEDREDCPGSGELSWYIDPIDGSANHLRGIPYVALTAGLLRGQQPLLGVVHDLLRGHTLSAWRDGGAWRRRGGAATAVDPLTQDDAAATDLGEEAANGHRAPGEPLAVSTVERLADAMAVVHLARRGPLIGREGALPRLLWSIRKIRCMGSIALDLALLAAGEVDLLVTGRGKPQRTLDILGGLVLLREAGGTALSADGQPFQLDSRTLVAGPETLCRQFCELMAGHDLESWTAEMSRRPG